MLKQYTLIIGLTHLKLGHFGDNISWTTFLFYYFPHLLKLLPGLQYLLQQTITWWFFAFCDFKVCLFYESLPHFSDLYCQAQGPNQGPTQGQAQGKGQSQDIVRSWSGQVRSGQTPTPTPTQMWDLSYTLKLVFTTTHHTISKWVFCDTLWHIYWSIWSFLFKITNVKVLGQNHNVKLNCR